MLTDAKIESNKMEFINLIRSISREDCQIDRLLYKLEKSDFFVAPASSRYHSAYKGGLCSHSLNVYRNLKKLVEGQWGDIPFPVITEDTIKIVALFHDISKMNFYESYAVNKKVYREDGSKSDALGRFEWVSEEGFKAKEPANRYLFGTHGQNSERMLSYYIPLSEEESCAIINHHSVYDNPSLDISPIYNRYSLAVLLHVADMLSTYIDEKIPESK